MGAEWGGTFLPILILFIILYTQRQREKAAMYRIINRKNGTKGDSAQMRELAKRFTDKECIIYTFNSQLEGVIKEVSDGAMIVEKNGTLEAVNLDFVTRIREYPRKKNGKKKSIVID